ncbi:MAG: tRNA (adenosine(37)-N6)-threonylcarbamoyltransferase complex transferase subunit TsaD [Bacteroidota bacterium]|nr:tRNA (adenosine(37)-N6)-threonylcarbamoyltransferase complex transferase subunit TsaD [Bacteroidota bacterium]
MNNNPVILGIESSCDDTSAAILKGNKVLSNIVATQQIHKKYGGVVPELASREHQKNIIPVVDIAIKKAGIKKHDINAVSFTKGPGLLGSLLVGTSFAKGFSLSRKIPMICVNHMQAHILAHFIKDSNNPVPKFPFLCLTVSGGHTQLVKVNDYNAMKIIGTTLDDAAGEAFDKCAKMLGLSYPGGYLIDQYAKKGYNKKFKFSKPKVQELNFSFSGFKTSVLYFIKKEIQLNNEFINKNIYDLCASIQYTIVEILLEKIEKAIKQTGIKTIAIAGGVSANSYLRERLEQLHIQKKYTVFIPKLEYCTDNAAMVAIAGLYKYKIQSFSSYSESASARLSF